MKTLLTTAIVLSSLAALAQSNKKSVVIGSLATRPNALLIVNPQNSDQGVLLPQLSTGQRMSLKPNSPEEDGLIVFDRTLQSYYYWSNGTWVRMATYRQNRFQSIDPLQFKELELENSIRHNNTVIFENDNSFVTASKNGNGEEIAAPINLPHGAVLNEVTVYYMDNHQNNITIKVLRKGFTGGSEEIIAWESSGSSQEINAQSFTSFKGKETIDLENFTYRVSVEFDLDNNDDVDTAEKAKQRLYGIRIKYQE